jgi:hypothetical protein
VHHPGAALALFCAARSVPPVQVPAAMPSVQVTRLPETAEATERPGRWQIVNPSAPALRMIMLSMLANAILGAGEKLPRRYQLKGSTAYDHLNPSQRAYAAGFVSEDIGTRERAMLLNKGGYFRCFVTDLNGLLAGRWGLDLPVDGGPKLSAGFGPSTRAV